MKNRWKVPLGVPPIGSFSTGVEAALAVLHDHTVGGPSAAIQPLHLEARIRRALLGQDVTPHDLNSPKGVCKL